jgi:hypothetical protein
LVGPQKAMRDLGRYFVDASRALRRPVDGVMAIERHKSGSSHAHGLLRLGGGLQSGDIAVLSRVWFEEHGFVRLEVPRALEQVAGYCAKYMCKDLADMVISAGLVRALRLERRFGRG